MTSDEKKMLAVIGMIIVCVGFLVPLGYATLWMSYIVWIISPLGVEPRDVIQLAIQWFAILALIYTIFRSSSFLFWKARGF